MSNLRTRFAPSPTGYIHVGNVRSALYPFFIARQSGGQFILRIEDTDQNRFVEGAEELIIDVLHWLGVNWDEGPDGDTERGNYGPYHQTDRRDIYHRWAMKLVDKGLAYADPRPADEIKALQDQAKAEHRLFLYRDHRPTNPPAWDGTQPLRFKVTNPVDYHWHDEVMGDLSAGRDAVDDFIIIKSDGLPTYNFAHIVDDAEMKITHVIRGQEYISSMPKYLALYDALELPWPVFAHLPHILAPEGNKKLGKRDGAKSVTEYRDEGYLPEAMVNFLACLGWNDGTEQEIFSLAELEKVFDAERLNKSPAIFDPAKLRWMNGCYIRALPFAEFHALACREYDKFITREINREELSRVLQPRIETLNDIAETAGFIETLPAYGDELFNNKKMKTDPEIAAKALQLAYPALENLADWSNEGVFECLKNVAAANGMKNGQVLYPVRIALTGLETTPGGASEIATVLGREETLRRLKLKLQAQTAA